MSIFKSLAVAAIAAGALGACQTVVEPNPVCDFTKVQEARDNPSSGPVLVSLVPGAHTDMPLNTVNITDVATAAGETGTAAGQVSSASSEMKSQADRLRNQIETFLREVQAA